MSHIPLTVSQFTATGTGDGVTVSVPAEPVSLAPGASATVPISVDWDAGPRRAQPLATVEGTATLTLHGSISSPWAATMTDELGLDFEPALTGGGATVPLSAQRGSIVRWIIGAVLLAVVAGLLWWWRQRRLSPSLSGTLRVRSAAGDERRVPLSGRRLRLTAGTSGLPGVGEVTAARASVGAGRTDLVIAYSRDGSVAGRAVVTCAPDATVEVGGATFTWEGVPAQRQPAAAS